MMICPECGWTCDDLQDFLEDRYGCNAKCDIDTSDGFTCFYCNRDMEPAIKCAICGEYVSENDVETQSAPVCPDCVDNAKRDLDLCVAINSNTTDIEKESVRLRPLFAAMFSEDEIEEILMRELREAHRLTGNIDLTPFVEIDKWWFSEQMVDVKGVKK